jgi:hypothetical protein
MIKLILIEGQARHSDEYYLLNNGPLHPSRIQANPQYMIFLHLNSSV